MKRIGVFFILYYYNFVLCFTDVENDITITKEDILEPPTFVNWPKGSIPFFINPEHFDNEQTLTIMTSLSLIAFKTCLKFAPVMVPPSDKEHVLTFENPRGIHKCEIHLHGHPKNEPHVVTLGYACLEAPWMDRIVLRALGLPFEHNRQSRDSFIDVQYENIEQHAIPLFTKDVALPAALRALPYDVHSVMHFGDRDYSKNGHRTIIFKDRDTKQKWNGPSDLDIRKIEIIYGTECRERDRQEKLELCHMYPGVPLTDRRKRSVDLDATRSLRLNPNITPPINNTKELQEILIDLDIEEEVQKIVEDVYQLSNKALMKTRIKYCNQTKTALRSTAEVTDIHGVVQVVAEYAKDMVSSAINNMTTFCAESDSIEKYQIMRCNNGCQKSFYSTKHGIPYPSTKHQPYIRQYTRHLGGPSRPPFYAQFRAHDTSEQPQNATSAPLQRSKRQALEIAVNEDLKSFMMDSELGKQSKLGAPEASNRESMEENTQTKSARRRGSNSESGQDDSQSSDEGDKKRKKPTRDPDYVDIESTPKLRKPNIGRFKKRPVMPNSEETAEIYSTAEEEKEEKIDERNGEKAKPPMSEESDEKSHHEFEEIPIDQPKPGQRAHGQNVTLSKENEEFYKQRKWPNGVVRYLINKTCTNFDLAYLRRRLAKVNSTLTLYTCVQIEEIQEVSQLPEDYLVLDNSPDFITGRVGGRQIFGSPELLKGEQHRQHTAMVVMAMLGFYFELSRHDRDDYVKVHQRHIRPDKLHHFEKLGADATLPLPYDYASATHPPWMYWRRFGKKGISTVATYKDKDPDGSIMKSLGQNRHHFSYLDIIKINSVYGMDCMAATNYNEPKSDWENKDD